MSSSQPINARRASDGEPDAAIRDGVVVDRVGETGPVSAEPRGRTHHLSVARDYHPMRWVASIVILVLAAMFVRMLATNKNLQWSVVGHYFFSTRVFRGVANTLLLTVVAMVIGVLLGVLLAVMRRSSVPLVAGGSWLYIWFFRGTPLLVQIIFWFNIALLTPHVSLGIPFGPAFVTGSTNNLITPWSAAVVALSLNEAAYMAEIVRGGLQSIDSGQAEAAHSIGLTPVQTFWYVTLPQAMRVIVPPTGNQVIGMLKTTSLVSVIAVPELLYSAELIYSRTYQVIPLLVVASLWYIVVSTLLTFGQYYVERHYAKGASRELPPTPLQKLRRSLTRLATASRQRIEQSA